MTKHQSKGKCRCGRLILKVDSVWRHLNHYPACDDGGIATPIRNGQTK